MFKRIPKNLQKALFLALVLGLVAGSAAFAGPGGGGPGAGMGCPGPGMGPGMGMGHGMGMGPGRGGMMGKRMMMMNLTPEQAGQIFDLRQKFMNDTAGLRKEMMVKGVELAQLWKAEKPDEKAIVAKVKELGALRNQFMEKAVAQRLEMRKIVPQWGGPGMGPGKGAGAWLPSQSEDLSAADIPLDLELVMYPGGND